MSSFVYSHLLDKCPSPNLFGILRLRGPRKLQERSLNTCTNLLSMVVRVRYIAGILGMGQHTETGMSKLVLFDLHFHFC